MKRLLGRLFKIGVALAVLGGLAYAAKKLMGGLGPEPGSDTAPKAWPSLIPEPAADATEPIPTPTDVAATPEDAADTEAAGTSEPDTGAASKPSGSNGDTAAPSTAEA